MKILAPFAWETLKTRILSSQQHVAGTHFIPNACWNGSSPNTRTVTPRTRVPSVGPMPFRLTSWSRQLMKFCGKTNKSNNRDQQSRHYPEKHDRGTKQALEEPKNRLFSLDDTIPEHLPNPTIAIEVLGAVEWREEGDIHLDPSFHVSFASWTNQLFFPYGYLPQCCHIFIEFSLLLGRFS